MKHKLLILFIAIMFWAFLVISNARAEAPELALKDQSIESIVTHFANESDVDPDYLLAVMRCESNGKQSTVGDKGLSRGIFQIQKPTWERFTKEMGEKLDYNSPMDQAKVAAWAFANGHDGEWSTAVSIKKGGSYSFYSQQLKKHFTVRCTL